MQCDEELPHDMEVECLGLSNPGRKVMSLFTRSCPVETLMIYDLVYYHEGLVGMGYEHCISRMGLIHDSWSN